MANLPKLKSKSQICSHAEENNNYIYTVHFSSVDIMWEFRPMKHILSKSKVKCKTKTGTHHSQRKPKSTAREIVVVRAQVNKHALWVRPGISSDPRVKQQVVVARLFAERQIFIGL